MNSCIYCDENLYGHHTLSSGSYVHLSLTNFEGEVYMTARRDNECSYKPKFCPECGCKIIRKGIDIDEH